MDLVLNFADSVRKIVAAVNEALRGMHAISEEKMSAVTGGMNIPGL